MPYSRLPSGPSPMTTRRAARRTSGGATPPPQQPATTVNTNSTVTEDDISKELKAASLRRTAEMIAKVAMENGDTPTEARRANSATSSTPKTSPTKITIKNPSHVTNGFTQPNETVAKSSSSSPAAHAFTSEPAVAILSKSTGGLKIKLTNKMPTPPEYDDEGQDIKAANPSTPTPFSLSQSVPQFVKPVSSSDKGIKGEDGAEAPSTQKTMSDAPNTPPSSQFVSPPDDEPIASSGKRKRGEQDDATTVEPPKKRGRKPKAQDVAANQEPHNQETLLATPKQTEKVVGAETLAQLSPDPTGKRKRLAKKLVGNVSLETELDPAVAKKLTTMEQQIAQAIIKGMSSKSLSSGRETRQRAARTSTGHVQAQPEEKNQVAKKAASPMPISTPTPAPATQNAPILSAKTRGKQRAQTPVPSTQEAPTLSEKAKGKRKAEEPPAEVAAPPKKRGRPAKKTTVTPSARKSENLEIKTGPSQPAKETPATAKSSQKTAEKPTATRPKRRSRAAKTPEPEFRDLFVDDPLRIPRPPPRISSPNPYDPMPRKYNGIFSASQQYANSWEESSFADIDPNTLNCPTFGSFTTPVPFDSSPFPRPSDLQWDGEPMEIDTILGPCRCDLCKRTLENVKSLRHGTRYFFSYASNIHPSDATEEAGAVPVAIGKISNHRFLICGNPLPGTAPPKKSPASGLPTIAPSPGDAVYGMLYECPSHDSLVAMAALAGRGEHDFHKAKVSVELQAHVNRRHPVRAGHPGTQALRTVGRVDALVMRAPDDRYHMPARPEQDAVAPPPKNTKEDKKKADEDVTETGRPRRRGRPKQLPPPPPQKTKPAPAPEPEPEPQQEQQEAVELPQGEVAPLVEGYAEVMNGALAEATLTGGWFPDEYMKKVIRKWIPAPQERV